MSRRWQAAVAEHEAVLGAYVDAVRAVAADAWHQPMGAGRWTPAELTLHVDEAYALGAAAVAGGSSMRLRVSPARAWVLRNGLLRFNLMTRTFPRGAPAPREVKPDAEVARSRDQAEATSHLMESAAAAATALRSAAPDVRFTHAYFGPLPPLTTLRLLSAHTRHHTRGLTASQRGQHERAAGRRQPR